jgi:hypothetical protein
VLHKVRNKQDRDNGQYRNYDGSRFVGLISRVVNRFVFERD